MKYNDSISSSCNESRNGQILTLPPHFILVDLSFRISFRLSGFYSLIYHRVQGQESEKLNFVKSKNVSFSHREQKWEHSSQARAERHSQCYSFSDHLPRQPPWAMFTAEYTKLTVTTVDIQNSSWRRSSQREVIQQNMHWGFTSASFHWFDVMPYPQ